MDKQQQWCTIQIGKLKLSYRKLHIYFKRNFTTAHSSSASRVNFLVKAQFSHLPPQGFGQCGLPPKKPYCYLSDYNDCQQFMKHLENTKFSQQQGQAQQLFQGITENYFASCRQQLKQKSQFTQQLRQLLKILVVLRKNLKQEWKAPYSALQFCLFDLWAKVEQKSLTKLVFGANISQPQLKSCSFYTLSYEPQQEMIQNAISSLTFTHFIKIKYIDDMQNLLLLLKKLQLKTQNKIIKYIIDANASWSPQSCYFFAKQLSKPEYTQIKEKILYIQQPFPVKMSEQQLQKWKNIHEQSQIKIVADQSFFGTEQVQSMKKLCSAVNVKTQKAGGLINSLKAIILAKQQHLEVMLGSMVSTQLGCAQTYVLHPLTQYLDVDGALLLQKPVIKGGFSWGAKGFLEPAEVKHFGLEVDAGQMQNA